jgi:hypothetical protein
VIELIAFHHDTTRPFIFALETKQARKSKLLVGGKAWSVLACAVQNGFAKESRKL